MNSLAVYCESLTRVYRPRSVLGAGKEVWALRDLNLEIPTGVVFGLLGPNGAGKTTTVRILSTLLVPTSGTARVMGHDVVRDTRAVRDIVGLAIGGDRGFFGRISARENLYYFASLSGYGRRDAKRRTEEVLSLVDLVDRGDALVETYSRGMRQRLHLARAMFTQPRVLFLDEPTLGIDPVMAREFRALIPKLASDGTSVLLTTHYMLEADELCQQIAIVNHGRVVVSGTPTEIKSGFGRASVVEAHLREGPTGVADRLLTIPGIDAVEIGHEGLFATLRVFASGSLDLLELVRSVVGKENLDAVAYRERTLEEAYLAILN